MSRISLATQLQRLADERWSRRALRSVLRSAWLGLCAWCVGVGLSLLLGREPDFALISAAALLVLGIGLVVLLRTRRMTPLDVARRLDQRFQLQEQLSTAIELADGRIEAGSIGALLLGQSAQTVRYVRASINQRQRAPWSDLITLLALLLAAIGLFLLGGIGRPQIAAEPLPLPALVGAAAGQPKEPLDPPNNQPNVPGDGPGDLAGAADPNQAGRQSAGQGQPGAAGQTGQNQAGQNQAGQQGQQSVVDPAGQRNLDALADALRDQGITRPAAEALDQGNLAQAAQDLRELADQASQLSDAARQRLAESLRRAAAQIQQSNPDLAQQLRDSARGLERGDDKAAQALENLANAIEQQGKQTQSAGAAQPQAGNDPGQAGQDGQSGQGQDSQGQGNQPGGGSGAGNVGAGEQRPIANPGRLGVDGQPVALDVQGPGTTSAPAPDQATAGDVSAVGGVSGGNSTGNGGSGLDPLRVPLEERDVVQGYFTH
jgi:hypothetical protein